MLCKLYVDFPKVYLQLLSRVSWSVESTGVGCPGAVSTGVGCLGAVSQQELTVLEH